jgi:hypothetical protein
MPISVEPNLLLLSNTRSKGAIAVYQRWYSY